MDAKNRLGQAGAIRVALIDGHAVFRSGLAEQLEEQGIAVACECATVADGVRFVREQLPDVAVIELTLGGADAFGAIEELRACAPKTPVVVLTAADKPAGAERALVAGASGYLLKEATIEEIAAGIRAAAAGGTPVSPRIAAELLERYRRWRPQDRTEMTERERAVLKLVCEGRSNPEIAAKLKISVQTVKEHVTRLIEKLGAENRTQVAVEAVRRGLF